jgi:hypothetical protein
MPLGEGGFTPEAVASQPIVTRTVGEPTEPGRVFATSDDESKFNEALGLSPKTQQAEEAQDSTSTQAPAVELGQDEPIAPDVPVTPGGGTEPALGGVGRLDTDDDAGETEKDDGLGQGPERGEKLFVGAQEKLKLEYDNKKFHSNPALEKRVEAALKYKEPTEKDKVTQENSDALKEALDVYKELGGEYLEALGEIEPHVQIAVGKERYSLEEYKQKMADSSTTEAEKQELQKGLYAFTSSEQGVKEADGPLDTVGKNLEKIIETKKGKGEKTRKEEDLLTAFKLARKLKEGPGDCVVYLALKKIQNAGIEGLDPESLAQTIKKFETDGMLKPDNGGMAMFKTKLRELGFTEYDLAEISQGKLDKVLDPNKMNKILGLSNYLTGKNGREVFEEMGRDDYNKQKAIELSEKTGIGVGLIALMLLLGMVMAAGYAVSGQAGGGR